MLEIFTSSPDTRACTLNVVKIWCGPSTEMDCFSHTLTNGAEFVRVHGSTDEDRVFDCTRCAKVFYSLRGVADHKCVDDVDPFRNDVLRYRPEGYNYSARNKSEHGRIPVLEASHTQYFQEHGLLDQTFLGNRDGVSQCRICMVCGMVVTSQEKAWRHIQRFNNKPGDLHYGADIRGSIAPVDSDKYYPIRVTATVKNSNIRLVLKDADRPVTHVQINGHSSHMSADRYSVVMNNPAGPEPSCASDPILASRLFTKRRRLKDTTHERLMSGSAQMFQSFLNPNDSNRTATDFTRFDKRIKMPNNVWPDRFLFFARQYWGDDHLLNADDMIRIHKMSVVTLDTPTWVNNHLRNMKFFKEVMITLQSQIFNHTSFTLTVRRTIWETYDAAERLESGDVNTRGRGFNPVELDTVKRYGVWGYR